MPIEFKIGDLEVELLKKQYENDNYKIEYCKHDKPTKRCLIACSGNGLYYPNTNEVVQDVLIKNDRYEWQSITKNELVQECYDKIIFIRDIYKQWYVTGISQNMSSIPAVISFLKKETEGYEVVTIGNSAGGYMATLLGTKLNARAVINISGQFDLKPEYDDENALLVANKDKIGCREYQNLCDAVRESQVKVFYFYAANCNDDILQLKPLQDADNFYSFAFDTSEHGVTMVGANFPYVISRNVDELVKLHQCYKGKKISQIGFMIHTLGIFSALKIILWKIIK